MAARSYALDYTRPAPAPRPDRTATHKIPSGMGGVFHVEVLRREAEHAVVRIHQPKTEWHHWRGEIRVPLADLEEIAHAD